MPRAAAPHGSYRAYLRHRRAGEAPCARCKRAADERNARERAARAARKSGGHPPGPTPPVGDAPTTDDGHVSRVEVLKELLQTQRELLPALKQSDPSRAYLLMREQRETLREIAELQGNGQTKGVTLADQLAEARARRLAGSSTSSTA